MMKERDRVDSGIRRIRCEPVDRQDGGVGRCGYYGPDMCIVVGGNEDLAPHTGTIYQGGQG